MKAIPLPDGDIELWKDQDKELEVDQEGVSLFESEILAEEEDQETSDAEEDKDSDQEGSNEETEKNLDKEGEKNSSDDDEEYVFEEDKNPAGHFLPLPPNSTHNHSLLIEMEKKCFSPTPKMQAIQKLILKLMHFLLTYQLDIHTAASPIYSFLAISSIHPEDTDQMRDSLFFSARYSGFIYCNVLYTIGISLRQYAIQNFAFPAKTLTEILRQFTDTYCKNTTPYISSHLLILRLLAFGINKRISNSPSIIILDKEKALIRCQNIELDLKNIQMFFRKVTMEANHQLTFDLLLGMELQDWPELTCQEFAKWENFSNKDGGSSFVDLVPTSITKPLSSALLTFILSKPELKEKFLDKKQKWCPAKISAYIRLVQKFLRILMLLVHVSGSLPPRATELGTTKHSNSWLTHQRNLFLDPESGLMVLKLSYHKSFKITRREAKGAHFLPACVSHLILVYLVLVLPFIKSIERKIQISAGQGTSPLLFNVIQRPMGTLDLALTMSKYSQEFLGQRMIPSIYRHIIIGMIQLCTSLEINKKTGGFLLTNTKDIGSQLGATQAHHSQHRRNMTYARPSNILQNMSAETQQLLLQYCEIYHTTMDFHNIRLSILPIPTTPRSSSHSGRKHGPEAFSPFAIRTKRTQIIPTGERPIFQGVFIGRRSNISLTSNVGATSDSSDPFI